MKVKTNVKPVAWGRSATKQSLAASRSRPTSRLEVHIHNTTKQWRVA